MNFKYFKIVLVFIPVLLAGLFLFINKDSRLSYIKDISIDLNQQIGPLSVNPREPAIKNDFQAENNLFKIDTVRVVVKRDKQKDPSHASLYVIVANPPSVKNSDGLWSTNLSLSLSTIGQDGKTVKTLSGENIQNFNSNTTYLPSLVSFVVERDIDKQFFWPISVKAIVSDKNGTNANLEVVLPLPQ
ncbi:MAG: hypothetical protein WC797_03670 [Candidatus Paceibacterota bacterium]|jgi:hypothetical protein